MSPTHLLVPVHQSHLSRLITVLPLCPLHTLYPIVPWLGPEAWVHLLVLALTLQPAECSGEGVTKQAVHSPSSPPSFLTWSASPIGSCRIRPVRRVSGTVGLYKIKPDESMLGAYYQNRWLCFSLSDYDLSLRVMEASGKLSQMLSEQERGENWWFNYWCTGVFMALCEC